MSKWFAMARSQRVGNINIHSDIGIGDADPGVFKKALDALGDVRELRISINSNGGDISAGFAVFNMLKRNPARKVVTIEGIAASMASVIAMVGDEIVMPENAMLMVHNPWGGIVGSAEQIKAFGGALESMKQAIVKTYSDRTGRDPSVIQFMMDRETGLTAEEAVQWGFADRVEQPLAMVASIDVSRFKRPPAAAKQPASSTEEIYARWNSCRRDPKRKR